MSKPVPLKKIDELSIILNNIKPSEILSEFKYARCNRLLNSAKSTTPEDWWLMCKSLVEVYANNLKEANEIAEKNLSISSDITVLRNTHFVFSKTFNMVKSVETVEKIVDLSNLIKTDLKLTVPTSIELEFFLTGNINKLDLFKYDDSLHRIFSHLKLIQDNFEINQNSFLKLCEIVHSLIIESNSQCQSTEYSYVDEELLITLYIDKEYKMISDLNKMLVRRCHASGLLDELNIISYLFLPFDETVDE
ncbi:hypothetical protein [Acinetobacter oleivorans]|uniref:hypothetical protein n=1 Tax=Acinetobacter oleivorans TaxID=1148157 RepID=UPI00125F2731|nr:hypothetical protein [Acinetobacter oleivorans]MCG6036896.1 hypothetical protein [Acinetobacter baumannii]